jgi:hypothetical protein
VVDEATNSSQSRLPSKSSSTLCAWRWGGFYAMFYDALAKRLRRNNRRECQPRRQCRLSEETSHRNGRQIQRRGGRRGREGATRKKGVNQRFMELVADMWEHVSHFLVSGVLGASPVGRGRSRGTGHRIGPHRTKSGLGGHGWELFLSDAPQNPLGV